MDQIDVTYFCKTKAESLEFSRHVAVILAKLYETNFNLEKVLMSEFGIQKKDKFMILLQENKVNISSSTSLKEFLTNLQNMVAALPVMSLVLAFEPKDTTLIALSEWFLLNVKKQALFEITVDPRMIAGVTISFNGRHLDFSIKSVFDKIVKDVMTPPPPATTTDEKAQIPSHHSPEHMHIGR